MTTRRLGRLAADERKFWACFGHSVLTLVTYSVMQIGQGDVSTNFQRPARSHAWSAHAVLWWQKPLYIQLCDSNLQSLWWASRHRVSVYYAYNLFAHQASRHRCSVHGRDFMSLCARLARIVCCQRFCRPLRALLVPGRDLKKRMSGSLNMFVVFYGNHILA